MLKKHMCIPFLDKNKGVGSYNWCQIDKSTKFSLALNPQTETFDFICDENPTEVVDHYQPELEQDIFMDESNAMFNMIFDMYFNMPVGTECILPCLICFPPVPSGVEGVSVNKAWLISDTTIVLNSMNTVDKKIEFTLKLGGTINRGTYTIVGGVPTFTPGSGSASTLSALTLGSETLTPTFSATTYNYTAATTESSLTVTATPTAAASNVVITVNGDSIASGGTATLTTGTNEIIVAVTNGANTSAYRVTVTKS